MANKFKLYFGFLALSALFLLQGCANENWMDNVGQPVVFSAVSVYENGPATRTSYSGVDNDENVSGYTKKYERIDWVENDKIQIYSPQARTPSGSASADYKVVGVTANGKYSEADITNLTEDARGLQWSEGTNDFYALYPSPIETGIQSAGGSANIVSNNFDVTIPATQKLTLQTSSGIYQPDMNTAYMWAAASGQSTQTEPVELAFHPAVTAFQFTVGSPKALTIYSFEMSSGSQSLNGQVTAVINSSTSCTYTCPAKTAANSKVSVTFNGTTGITIAAGDSLKFAVFAMPQDLTNMTVKFETSDGTRKLALNEEVEGTWRPYVFKATKKYRITNLAIPEGETWDYYIDEIPDITTYGHVATTASTTGLPFTVKSYKTSRQDGHKEAVTWKLKFQKANGEWTYDITEAAYYGQLSTNIVTGNGGTAGESVRADIARPHTDSEKREEGYDSEKAAIGILQSNGTRGSATSVDTYFDLSKHAIYGDIDTETTQETANCYVVSAPGYYKFPLVYGNALNYNSTTAVGGVNAHAYTASASEATNYYLTNFLRHDNSPIVGPWINKSTSEGGNGINVDNAVIVWQDIDILNMPKIIKDEDVAVVGNYITFKIDYDNIRPGNVVIAARSGNTIVWSWHIWITEKDLSPHYVDDKHDRTHGMMGYNLGWTDAVSAYGLHWLDWTFNVKVVQIEDGEEVGDVETFKVKQIGESITIRDNVGSNCFYQWGRKDPILPGTTTGDHTTSVNKHYYSAKYNDITETNTKVTTVNNNNGTFGQSIQSPYKIFYSRNNYLYVKGYYGNLWDADMIANNAAHTPTGNALSNVDRLPVKTVYDPSPRGYVVPCTFAFTGFSKRAYNDNNPGQVNGSATTQGINFSDGRGGNINFPYSGARGGDGVTPLYDVTNTMYYWTAGKLPSDSSSDQKSKNLTCLGMNDVRPIWDQYSEGAYAVRSVLQVEY